MNKQIGISLGSLLPWSAFPLNDLVAQICALPIAAAITKRIGASFWQVLPFKGITAKGLLRVGIEVRFIENTWNATTFWRHLACQPGEAGVPTLWQDVALFPKPVTAVYRAAEIFWHFPNTRRIQHNIPTNREGFYRTLIEIHPDMGMDVTALQAHAAEISATHKPYVLDTKHLRRPRGDGSESPLQPWQETLELLLTYTALVHFQPLDGEELQRTLNGEPTDLLIILQYLNGKYKGPFVIEIPPNILGPGYFANPHRMIQTLSAVWRLIEETV